MGDLVATLANPGVYSLPPGNLSMGGGGTSTGMASQPPAGTALGQLASGAPSGSLTTDTGPRAGGPIATTDASNNTAAIPSASRPPGLDMLASGQGGIQAAPAAARPLGLDQLASGQGGFIGGPAAGVPQVNPQQAAFQNMVPWQRLQQMFPGLDPRQFFSILSRLYGPGGRLGGQA